MNLASMAGTIIGDQLYCSSRIANGLFKIDLGTGVSELVRFFEDRPLLQPGLHRSCIQAGDYLWYAPGINGNLLHVYNCIKNEMNAFDCGGSVAIYNCEGTIWCIPCSGGDFISFDSSTLDYKKIKPIGYEAVEPYIKHGEGFLYGLVESSCIWFLIDNTGKICRYDTHNNQIELYETGVSPLITISKGKKGIWLTPLYGSKIILWNPEDGTKETFACDGMEKTEDERCFRFVIDNGINVYIFPSYADKNIQVLDGDLIKDYVSYPEDICFYEEDWSRFLNYSYTDGIYYINPANCNYLIKVNGKKIEYTRIQDFSSTEIEEIYANELLLGSPILHESENMSLERFVEAVKGRYL